MLKELLHHKSCQLHIFRLVNLHIAILAKKVAYIFVTVYLPTSVSLDLRLVLDIEFKHKH